MNSDISEFVLTGFQEHLFIREMQSGAEEVIICQEAAVVHLSWTVITLCSPTCLFSTSLCPVGFF